VKSYAKKLKVSVEEAGREIRYLELNKEADRITNEVVKSKETFVLEYEY
jgi:hypothetical protein